MKHLLLTTIAAFVLVGTAFADPIHDAAYAGDFAGVQAELDKGVDVNAEGEFGFTPLHQATFNGHKEVVELLIAKGADVNAKTKDGWDEWWTVLDWAELVRKIQFPASIGGEQESPQLIAARKEIADLLRKHGGKTGEELKAGGN